MTDKREYLHSISRVIDRMAQAEKDADRIIRNTGDLKEDIRKLREALESFLNDNLKGAK